MEIFMFSRSLELIGIVSNFSSLEWYRKLSEPGTFSISFLESDAGTLQTGMILYNTDEPEPGIITKLTRESNGKGSELVIAKGYTLSRWLNQRIVATRELLSGTPSSIMRTLVTNNAISPSNNDRKIPNLYLGNDDSVVTDTMQYQTEYTNLAKALTDIADSYELGYGLRFDMSEGKLYFDIWSGTDRTVTSENPCLFSPEFGSVFSQRYYEDISKYASYIICGSGNDDDRIIQDTGGGVGLDRYEIYATASGISKKNQTEAQIKAQLRSAGAEKLAKYPKTKGFESKINIENVTSEFFLGDYITCENKRWGVRENMQVRAIRRNVSATRDETTVTFGDPVPTLTSLLKAKE